MILKKFIPTYYAKSIFDIDIEFYLNNKIKFIISDLDNTLDAFDSFVPSKQALELNAKLKQNGIILCLISNNTSSRVEKYASLLGVSYISSAHKPFKKKVLIFLKKNDINLDNVIMIGDQTVTDILCANRAHIKSILVDKLVERDQPTTKFNRMFDKPIRKHLKNKNLLKDWRTKL